MVNNPSPVWATEMLAKGQTPGAVPVSRPAFLPIGTLGVACRPEETLLTSKS